MGSRGRWLGIRRLQRGAHNSVGVQQELNDAEQYIIKEKSTASLNLSKMDIIEKMAATGPQPLGWRPQTALEWGMRMCSGVTSQLTEMGHSFEQLKSELRSSSM